MMKDIPTPFAGSEESIEQRRAKSRFRFWLAAVLLLVFIGALLLSLFAYYNSQLFSALSGHSNEGNESADNSPEWDYALRWHWDANDPAHDPRNRSTLPLASEPSLFNETAWSSYRPQLYFGLKNRRADSPVFGLMWYQQGQTQLAEKVPLRHWAMHEDEVVFMWNMHDGRSFGSQNLRDGDAELRTDWLNFGAASWMARINVQRQNWTTQQSMVLYFALQDNKQSRLNVLNEAGERGEIRFLEGNSPAVRGNFAMSIRSVGPSAANWTLSELVMHGEPLVDMARVGELVKNELKLGEDGTFAFDRRLVENEPNFAALQITANENSLVEILFLAEKDAPPPKFEEAFAERANAFRANFSRAFPILKSAPEVYHKMGYDALSNMLGGIGVWHENCLMRSNLLTPPGSIHPYGPFSLISAVPARSGFPRGFIWDEGFHNLLIHKFDPSITVQILGSYLDMMNVDGWIPREIALGSEAAARIPGSFLVQEDWVANPPMFFYVLREMINSPEILRLYGLDLVRMYPRLKHLYIWLRNSQSGPRPGTFRWRGRNATQNQEVSPNTLSSGFDDYPRASHPTDEEYHLDLRCWMAMSSSVLVELAQIADDADFVPVIKREAVQLNDLDELDRLHWSERAQQYSDYGLHSFNVKLVPELTEQGEKVLVRKVLQKPEYTLVDDVNGYANLFPLLLQMLPADSPRLGPLLKQIGDSRQFWTPFGLRSISALSPYYNAWNSKDSAPYWRKPIWINMNYFALAALKHYSGLDGPHRELCAQLYAELRRNLVANVADQYAKTGFLWEHYNDQTGKGDGNHPFTGWTALILKVMTESY